MKKFWKIAFNNLIRNKRRTLATVFTICFGYVGMILLSAYILRVNHQTRSLTIYMNHTGHISIFKKNGADFYFSKPSQYILAGDILKQVQNVLDQKKEYIEKTGYFLNAMGLLSSGNNSQGIIVEGFDPNLEEYLRNHIDVRTYLSDIFRSEKESQFSEYAETSFEAISITLKIAERLGKRIPFSNLTESDRDVQLAGKTIDGNFNAVNAQLGAIHNAPLIFTDEFSVLGTVKNVQTLMDTDGFSKISLFLKDDVSVSNMVSSLKAEFSKLNLPIDVFPYFDENVGLFYTGTMSFLMTMGFFMFFLIISVVVLSVINTVTMGIIERTKEIGTLRALGFRPEQVALMFVLETFLITTFCLILGVFLGYGISSLITSMKIYFKPSGISQEIQFVLGPELWACALIGLAVLFFTTLTAYIVSYRKTKQPLISLLTDTGANA